MSHPPVSKLSADISADMGSIAQEFWIQRYASRRAILPVRGMPPGLPLVLFK